MKRKPLSTPPPVMHDLRIQVDDALYLVRPIDLTPFRLSVLITIEVSEDDTDNGAPNDPSTPGLPARKRRFTDKLDLYSASDRKRVTRECHERCFSVYDDYTLESHLEKVIFELERHRDNRAKSLPAKVKPDPEVQVELHPRACADTQVAASPGGELTIHIEMRPQPPHLG